MLAKYLSVLAATAAAVCAQYTGQATTMCSNGCNPIIAPSLQQAVPAGAVFAITWTPTTTGPVAIELLRGPTENVQYLSTIVGSTPNSGTFSWSVPTTLEPDVTHYGIRLVSLSDGTFQYSTQFGISNPGYSGASSSVVVSSSASSTASSSAVVSLSAASNSTASSYPTTSAPTDVFSTGSPYSNSSILSASPSISLPTSLETAAATTTAAGSASKTSASATAKASSGADSIKMSIGGAVVALMAAVAAL